MHSLKLLRGGHTRWACSARCLHTYIYAVSRVRGVYRPSEVLTRLHADTHPSYNTDGQYTAPVLLFSFLIGLQCSTYAMYASFP